MIGLRRYDLHIHTHIENVKLLSNKRQWSTATCSNMDGPRKYEVQWERQILYDVTYLWNLKTNTNEYICLQCRRPMFDPWIGKIRWRREWRPSPVFLPGEFCGEWSLVGYSPWDRKELDLPGRLTLSLQNLIQMNIYAK